MRKILCIFTPEAKEAALQFIPFTKNTVEVSFYEIAAGSIDLFDTNRFDFTDLITIGFSYPNDLIEKLYLNGILHILTIDEYYDDHPLTKLNVDKPNMPFLDYRGKWAILVGDPSWYKQVITELLK